MHLLLQLFGVFLAIVAVTSHEYGSSVGHHSGEGDFNSESRLSAAGRSFGGSLGRSKSGWGSSSGYGTNARSHQSNDHANNFLGRSNCGSGTYGVGGQDSSSRSTW